MHERGIRIRIRVAFVSLDVLRGEKEKERKKKNKNNQEEYSTTDEEERRGEERRVYEFRMDGWMRGEGNVKRQEPPSSLPLYGPARENNGRTVSRSCFMGCNCGADPWRVPQPR